MIVAEHLIDTNHMRPGRTCYSPGNISAARMSAGRFLYASGTTTTLPSRLPDAMADCFDLHTPQFMTGLSVSPIVVLLDFKEFAGLAPIEPLSVTVEFREGLCELEHSELGIYGRGHTCEEAVVDFLEYLAADFRAYAEESDDNLDRQARNLADHYRRSFRRL